MACICQSRFCHLLSQCVFRRGQPPQKPAAQPRKRASQPPRGCQPTGPATVQLLAARTSSASQRRFNNKPSRRLTIAIALQHPCLHQSLSIQLSTMAELRRKLVIVGDGACGKTCLLMCVLNLGPFPLCWQPVCHALDQMLTYPLSAVFSPKEPSLRSARPPSSACRRQKMIDHRGLVPAVALPDTARAKSIRAYC